MEAILRLGIYKIFKNTGIFLNKLKFTKSRFCIPSGIVMSLYALVNIAIFVFIINGENFDAIRLTFILSTAAFFILIFAFLLAIANKDVKLRNSERQYHTLFNSVGDSVTAFPYSPAILNEKFTDINGEAIRKLGYTRDEFMNLSPADIIVKTEHEKVAGYLKEIVKEKKLTFETFQITKYGNIIEVEVKYSLIDLCGKGIIICVARDVTERKALEREVFNLYEERKEFVQDLPVGVFKASLDPDSCFLDINHEMVNIFEASSEKELLGVKIKDLYVNPDERYGLMSRLKKEGKINLIEEKRKTLRGKVIDVNMSVRLMENDKNAFEGVLENITERKILENALKKNEELFRVIAHNMPNGVILHRGGIIYANPKALDIFGYTEEELYGMNIAEIFDDSDKELIGNFIERRLKGEVFDVDNMHRTKSKDGRRLDIWVHGTTIKYEGKWTSLILITDYTKMSKIGEKIAKERDNLRYLSEHDSLTGLYNRRKFEGELDRCINLSYRYKRDLSLLMFDIDYFKKINDGYGHIIGDGVLSELANFIKSFLRTPDVFARYGGEEFMVIMPETNINNAVNVAERLRENVEDHKFKNINSLTISIGVSEFKENDGSESFLERVDKALYMAKNKGRNRVEVL